MLLIAYHTLYVHTRVPYCNTIKVKKILWDLTTCPLYHPMVEDTEFKQDPTTDGGGVTTDGIGTVRKCKFAKALVDNGETPDYVWEEFLDVTDNKMVAIIQEENRPSIVDFIGKVYHLEAINDDDDDDDDGESEWTRVSMSHLYRPKFMPLTSILATKVMKQPMGDQIYALAWGIKVRINERSII